MCGLLYLVALISVLIVSGVRGNTGSDKYRSRPVKCDLVQDLTLFRQLLNQESLLWISVTNELQELKKIINQNTQKYAKLTQAENATNFKITQ